ncbi:primosomal protein N' [Candidatus Xianfuyuplasma coldseepsis]|uniref:Replication restart protein PriA n=1 Tax=Candidatus Xianfuyuplasma coldseepsis TaxID=2782163 RepID=A0A7L7KP75_9MOLU|nr:primosomal protein N' [Xianfuyuplasma coldseepsis]QMS84335.1 primosomal protein N' [Xianfuyuplasma coldseepsis]
MIAEVLVDVPAKAVDRTFDYAVPAAFESIIEMGQRVQVPFGPRFIMGYVLQLKETTEVQGLKAIKGVMDLVPSLTRELLELGKTMQFTTTSPLVSIYHAMLPRALQSKYKKTLVCHDITKLDSDVAGLFNRYQEAPYNDSIIPFLPAIKQYIQQGVIEIRHTIQQRGHKKYITYLALEQPDFPVRGAKQQAIIKYLADYDEPQLKRQVLMATKASHSTIKSLLEKGIVTEIEEETYRQIQHRYDALNKCVTFTAEQQVAYDAIHQNLNQHQTFLLKGVTGSGKTEIYLNIIEDVVTQGKQAIMLVPEISLTPMMVSRFKGRFGEKVALLHSRLSIGEKYDEWRKIRRKEVDVVVGARSAIFAPFEHLGVIIIDEEHTDSYKQDTLPTYHAKDVAMMRAEYYDIPLILGSATPSVDSYFEALEGRYTMLTMEERANQTTLPDVYIEDMRYEFQGGNRSIFSKRLKALIDDRLAKKQQIMLLLNRRGHSTFVMCRNCGEVIMCPNCDISLTYHERNDTLRCHYCGHDEQNPTNCPYCGSPHIRYMGIGTEKVEETVKEMYPEAKVIRMDTDTTTSKNAHEELLYQFEHEGDILIGTQMIAKGLDFPNVTLVGVLAADMSLNLPDYQAVERTFQLLTQVSGRAGRHELEGEVVIQTYNPDHYAILYAKDHDYESFYKTEMKIRQLGGYTPYYNIVQILIRDKDVKRVLKIGTSIVMQCRKELEDDVIVLGPVLPKVARINNYYRAQIIIKHQQSPSIDRVLKELYNTYNETIMMAIDKHPQLL